MRKKILFEGAKYQFLRALREYREANKNNIPDDWDIFVGSLSFFFEAENSRVTIQWKYPEKNNISFMFKEIGVSFYYQGDSISKVEVQKARGILFCKSDPIQEKNNQIFFDLAEKVVNKAGICLIQNVNGEPRYQKEELFHDDWAENTDVSKIDVILLNEACTAPEMRYIQKRLREENIQSKDLLDIGCGLGEASVYFALEGYQVTATDISQKMLDAAATLARCYNVSIKTHKSTAENLNFPQMSLFDVIYVGNLFHHVDIDESLRKIVLQMKPEGILVSWEPLAYNPIINLYRRIATKVRTPDEHPLTLRDLEYFKKYFKSVDYKYFWLTTLVVFMVMWLVQRRDPNKERFWKKVIEEEDKWRWLYSPLEKVDTFLLRVFPFLRLLCWNVVIVAKMPVKIQE